MLECITRPAKGGRYPIAPNVRGRARHARVLLRPTSAGAVTIAAVNHLNVPMCAQLCQMEMDYRLAGSPISGEANGNDRGAKLNELDPLFSG